MTDSQIVSNHNFLHDLSKWMENSIVDEVIIIAILLAIVESFAQNTLKNSEHFSTKFILGLSIYMFVGYILHYGYDKFPLGKMNTLWSCVSIIFGVSVGYILYNEKINHWTFLAIFFAILAILCIYQSDKA
jgi:multidrug transporter EmrE-like cation transporter